MEFKKIKNKNWQFLLVGVVVIFMLSNFVSAFAVGFESTELRLYPGEVHDGAFSLQNYGTDVNDITVEATIEEGEDYITFTEGTRFDIPANTNVAAPVKISIPENARIGDNYPVKVLFRIVSGDVKGDEPAGGETSISFAFSYRRDITLRVVEKPSKVIVGGEQIPQKTTAGSTIWIWILAIVVIVIVVWMILKKKKK